MVKILEWCTAYIASDGIENGSLSQAFNSEDTRFDEFGRVMADACTTAADKLNRHFVFYSAVQAACYIMCFHGCTLAWEHAEHVLHKEYWNSIVTSKYLPLKYCIESVRSEFVRLARHCDLLSDDAIRTCSDESLNSNPVAATTRRAIITPFSMKSTPNATSRGAGSIVQGANPLDSFFPFDPCLLVNVHSFVEQSYRSWNGIPGLDVNNECEGSVISDGTADVNDTNSYHRNIIDNGFGGQEEHNSLSESVASSMASMSFTYGTDMDTTLIARFANNVPINDGAYGMSVEADHMVGSFSYNSSGASDNLRNRMANPIGVMKSTSESSFHQIPNYDNPFLREKRSRNFSIGSATGSW